jgi:hypothetical protein
MAQEVACLLHKHETLSQTPANPYPKEDIRSEI